MYKEIIRWSSLGQGELEQKIIEIVREGETKSIKGTRVNELIRMQNDRTKRLEAPITFEAKPKENYLLYYNYHSNSGYKTVFLPDGSFEIRPPSGGALSAFFSEVVILEETGKIIPFKQK